CSTAASALFTTHAHKPAASQNWVLPPQGNQPGYKIEQFGVATIPLQPGDSVILAVRIVIACLRPAEFISCQQHGNALRKKEGCEKITLLPVSQLRYLDAIVGTFMAAIPRMVVVFSVPIVFSVRMVVLVLIGDKVRECEPIVARNEVDAGRWFPAFVF